MQTVRILKDNTTAGQFYKEDAVVIVPDAIATALIASGNATTELTLVKLGTAATGVVASEDGDEINRKTTLTIAEYTQAVASAALGFGKKLYTMPEGAIKIEHVVVILATKAAAATAQPVIGVGSVVASGAVSVLSGTATFVDMLTGFTGTAISAGGTVSFKADTATAGVLDGTTTAKDVFLNMAATWATTENLTISGTVEIFWKYLGDK